jgi:hypothetical protein
MFKKTLLGVGVIVMLISSKVDAKVIRLSEDNSYDIGAKITQIRKYRNGDVRIKLKDICGHRHYMTLSDFEFEDWEAEEGKIKKKQKVKITIYNNDTPDNYKDDEVVHIMKR